MTNLLDSFALAHITGSADIKKVGFRFVEYNARPHRSLSQMFFNPYESGNEFLFCARRTFWGSLNLSLFVLFPVTSAAIFGLMFGISLFAAVFNKDAGSILFHSTCNALVDCIVAPLALLLMCTRGMSTALQASGVYDFDAPVEHSHTP